MSILRTAKQVKTAIDACRYLIILLVNPTQKMLVEH